MLENNELKLINSFLKSEKHNIERLIQENSNQAINSIIEINLEKINQCIEAIEVELEELNMTNKEQAVYLAIKKRYGEIADISYSIIRKAYSVEVPEEYKGKNGVKKIRYKTIDITQDEIKNLLVEENK